VEKVLLVQFGVINEIALPFNEKSAGISGCQSLRPFWLHFHQVPCRRNAHDHLTERRSELAKLSKVLSAEIIARDMAEATSPDVVRR